MTARGARRRPRQSLAAPRSTPTVACWYSSRRSPLERRRGKKSRSGREETVTDTDEAQQRRNERARKAALARSPESRREAARKAAAAKTPEQRRESARKGSAKRTPEQRSEASRKAAAARVPEGRIQAVVATP